MGLEVHNFYRLTCDHEFEGCSHYQDLGYINSEDIVEIYRATGWVHFSGGLWHSKWACPACKEKIQ